MKETQKTKITKIPNSVTLTQIIILVIGIVWIGFSLYMAIGPDPSFAQLGAYRWIMAGMTFAPGLFLVVMWFLLRKRWKPAWYLAVIALGLMSVVIIFDQVGWVDVLVMLGSAIPFVLLIIDRKWYLKTKN
ncbi:MAG TPA: hypothetical protein DIW44_05870 [Anaerolineaceae bacterium]|nr:hypothetical protein [Anaerolineaceae bacterium]